MANQDSPHMQEPWPEPEQDYGKFIIEDVAVFDEEADALRARECVNAMEGIKDPSAFVEQAKHNAHRLAFLDK